MSEVLWRAHPSWRGMIGWYVKRLLVCAVVIAIAALIWKTGHLAWYVLALVVVFSVGSVLSVGKMIRSSTVYTITTTGIKEQSGIFNKQDDSARHVKITNIQIDRSLWERMVGSGRIDFDTAQDGDGEANKFTWWGIPNPSYLRDLHEQVKFGGEVDSTID